MEILVKADPRQEALSNPEYVADYQYKLAQLNTNFKNISGTFEINADDIKNFVDDPHFWSLCQDRNAISQIHNMDRTEDYIIHHSLNMAILAGLIGQWLGFSPERRTNLVIAALLTDSGMLNVPVSIRNKQGKLEPDELNLMRNHTMIASAMITQSPLAAEKEIAEGVAQHHERNDGSGYPKKLMKPNISEFGRILALLDIYDAMASDRAYARRNSPFTVFDIIIGDVVNDKLDTEFGIIFIKNVCHSLNGAWGMLSTGEKARIVYMDETKIYARPMVQTETGKFYDLAAMRDIKFEYLLTNEEAIS